MLTITEIIMFSPSPSLEFDFSILYHRKASMSTTDINFVTFHICGLSARAGAHGINEMPPLCPEKAKNSVDTARKRDYPKSLNYQC